MPLPPPAPLRPTQQVEVWRGGAMLRLHGVVLTEDSLRGIPFLQPLNCDSCRLSLARSSIDSLRTGDPVGGFWGTAVLGAVALLAALVLACHEAGVACGIFEGGGT